MRLIGPSGNDQRAPTKIMTPTILRLTGVLDKFPSSAPAKSAPVAEAHVDNLPLDSLLDTPPIAASPLSSILSDPAEIRQADAIDVADFFPSFMVTVSATALTDVDLDAVVRDDALPLSELELTLLIDEQGKVVDVIAAPFETSSVLAWATQIGTVFKDVKFKPAEIDGRPVKSQMRIVVKSSDTPSSSNYGRASGMLH